MARPEGGSKPVPTRRYQSIGVYVSQRNAKTYQRAVAFAGKHYSGSLAELIWTAVGEFLANHPRG